LDLQKLDLNLWLAVDHELFNEPEHLNQFEANLRRALAEKMTPMNLTPGKIESYHPAPDELESFACINLDTDLADCSYIIAESVENGRALNIGVVERITQGSPAVDAHTLAMSAGFPGMILSPVSPHACILVNYSAFEADYSGLAQAILEQLIHFCGSLPQGSQPGQPLDINRDLVWRLRRHPLFYDAD
jgi:hypothetical protein